MILSSLVHSTPIKFFAEYLKGRQKKIFLILTVRNEEYYLPSFLKSIRRYVDGIVALDDGSSDNTITILKKEKKLVKLLKRKAHTSSDWNERKNREDAIRCAFEKGADWVLCADPDERFEKRFLKRMRFFIGRNDCCYELKFRELWDSPNQYRSDGIWGKKTKTVMFPLSKKMSFKHKNPHHFTWAYNEIENNIAHTDYSLYHLKMIKEEDRKKRALLYNTLDPEKKMQAIGYDYLVNKKGLVLTPIQPKHSYSFKDIPNDLKTS